MIQQQQGRFPQYLSAPLQVLWFEADEIAMIVLLFTISSAFGGWTWLSFIVGPYLYSKAKSKYPKSFLKHMLYFSCLKVLRHYPTSFETFFLE